MKINAAILTLITCLFFANAHSQSSGHEIIFCGEKIPVSDRFVADKLMNIIRKQMPYVNMPKLKERANRYFGIVERYLHATGLPEDFKYLAIVESGFTTAVSKVGATGFWQIMEPTARDWGLVVNENVDERNDIYKSTHAACKELARNYLYIRKRYGISSWVLAAAAYNNGIGNVANAINRQGNDYFQMKLNAETAVYVYKIIAVKELFEYPELYMKNFGYNVFNTSQPKPPAQGDDISDTAAFTSMELKVNENDGNHPELLDTSVIFDKSNLKNYVPPQNQIFGKITFVRAQIVGKYGEFKDGDLVSFELLDDMQVGNHFISKGSIVQWRGWKIDDRVYVDLGYDNNVIMYDLKSNHGLSLTSLKKKKKDFAIIRVNNIDG